QLEAAKRKLESCYLRSPFGGRVANMDSKIYGRSSDKFCTLIDDNYFDVEFSLLEAEIGEIGVGQSVIVSPFIADERKFTGTVTEINPLIDDKGQIKIRAKVKNSDGYLMEGMNVRIIIENRIPNRFVVPKDAVVIRDGYFVLFRLVDGAAVWTYVDVMMSNIDSHVVSGSAKKQTTISENDIIITSGNLNLADGTKVSPKSK
ncbi:MAG: efflux RND transporter periplasmic adaptor subunit, partial [Rikenellaceae bacterium]